MGIDRDGKNGQSFEVGLVVCRTAVVPDHPLHGLGVGRVAREGSELSRGIIPREGMVPIVPTLANSKEGDPTILSGGMCGYYWGLGAIFSMRVAL